MKRSSIRVKKINWVRNYYTAYLITEYFIPDSNQSNDLDLDSFWLVCGICQRVLSTALEIEPTGE